MANPIITNVGLVSRNDQLAVVSHVVIDGAQISADGFLARGTVLVKNTSGAAGKWHVYVHGTDTLVADGSRILQDGVKVLAGIDAFAAAYLEGFFKISSIVDAMGGAPFVAADLLLTAGFHVIEADEVRLK